MHGHRLWAMLVGDAHRVASTRRFLMAMLATGAVPDPSKVTHATFQGNMFGVHVDCQVHELEPHRWADVHMTGSIFGSKGVAGKAWYEYNDLADPLAPTLRLDKRLDKTLRRYRVKLIAVDPAPEEANAIELRLSLPAIGPQRMLLWRVPSDRERWCEL